MVYCSEWTKLFWILFLFSEGNYCSDRGLNREECYSLRTIPAEESAGRHWVRHKETLYCNHDCNKRREMQYKACYTWETGYRTQCTVPRREKCCTWRTSSVNVNASIFHCSLSVGRCTWSTLHNREEAVHKILTQ